MSNQNHKLDKQILQLHVRTGAVEGGACLTRHISGVSASSCSHRWQALQRAQGEDASYYNGKRAGWDVTLARFRRASAPPAPYPHQAHHIVPNAVLNDSILATAEASNTTLLAIVLRMGLLDAKYNLNHKSNMIMLPMSVEAANVLRLPRHLRPFEQSHDGYSAMVKSKVQPVIDEYAQLLEDAAGKPGEHPAPPDKLSKAKLMRVSAQMRAVILTWGRAVSSQALEDHAP